VQKWLTTHPRFGEGGDAPLSVEELEQLLYALEEGAAARSGILPESEARIHVHGALQNKIASLSTVLADVFSYWNKKRRKLGKPLLRKYWPQTAPNDPHPHSVFRPREKERYKLRRNRRNDMETFRKLEAVKADLTAARDLLRLLRLRERVKNSLLQVTVDSLHASIAEAVGTEPPTSAVLAGAEAGGANADLAAATVAQSLAQLPPSASPDDIALGGTGAGTGRARAKRRRSDIPERPAVGTERTRRRESTATGKAAGASADTRGGGTGVKETPPRFSVGGWRLPTNAPLAVINPLLPPAANSVAPTSMCGFGQDVADLGAALGVSLGQELSEGTWQALLAGVPLPSNVPLSAAMRVREVIHAITRGTEKPAGSADLPAWVTTDLQVQTEMQTQYTRFWAVRYSLGRAVGGGAWEDGAGLALGHGAVGAIGEGWTGAGQTLQIGPPALLAVNEEPQFSDEHGFAVPSSAPCARQNVLLRPRLGRGSRIIIDRVPLSENATGWRSAHALLSRRRGARALARRVQRRAHASGGAWAPPAVSSALPTHMLSSHAGDATDMHTHWARALNVPTTHGASADALSDEVAPRATGISHNTYTSWLAPSRFRPASLAAAVADVQKGVALPREDSGLGGHASGMAGARPLAAVGSAAAATAAEDEDGDVAIGGGQAGSAGSAAVSCAAVRLLPASVDTRQAGVLSLALSGAALHVKQPAGIAALLARQEAGEQGDGLHTPPLEGGTDTATRGYALDGVHTGFGAPLDIGHTHGHSGVVVGNASRHSGLLPTPSVSSGVNLKRLADVYCMEDSDDEELVGVAHMGSFLQSRCAHTT